MMRAASSPMEPLNKNILLAGEVIAEKWKIGEKIGEGTFSQIYSAYSIESRDKVAVKVEAPSSLKPVLEWESLILKSLQDCPYVCRYYYHGKHGDSTVLVMELLGDSMSMLRMSPDSIHGVPLAKAVSVGLEMLDCIEAFHRHGYVHRDIKASNFALSAIPERNTMKQARYYIIDFGLSRQHVGEDRQVLPARQIAEFRGTSMYASLSSHRRQELGPKDDLWSWFYLVMDFLRGELPWAADAQLKNRQTVLSLKEHFTEKNPSLLVEGLPGATQLLEMMDYLQSLKYEEFPDYTKIRKQLRAVGESSLVSDNCDSGDEEASADRKEAQAVAAVSAVDWSAIKSERERALLWADKAEEQKASDGASDLLLTIAKRYKTFFDTGGLSFDERVRVQSAVYRIEKKSRAKSSFLAPPPIQSFVKRRQSEQKMRSDALRKRRERDFQVRQTLELQNEQRMAMTAPTHGSSEIVHGIVSREGTPEMRNGAKRPVKSESSMEVSDSEDPEAKRNGHTTGVEGASQDSHADTRPSAPSLTMPSRQPPSMIPPAPPGNRWDRGSSHGAPVPPPPPPPGVPLSAQRPGPLGHPPPPPPPPPAGRYPPKGAIPPPPPGFPPNGSHGVPAHAPPAPPQRIGNFEPRYGAGTEPGRHYDAPVETREEHAFGYLQPQKSPRGNQGRHFPPETREDRGYGAQQQKSPRGSVPERRYDVPRETREERGYTYQRPQNSPHEKAGRNYDIPAEVREDRGYESYQRPHKPSREQHPVEGPPTRHGKERYYEEKRPRSRSRSPRRGGSRSRHRSYSRSSSRSRSRSYSVSPSRSPSRSPSPPSHSHRRSSRDYADRHRDYESRKVEAKKAYSRKQRARSRSSSRSRSPSASPPTKRYRRRSSDLSHTKSSHRHSSHSTSRRRSHSKEYPKDYPQASKYSKEHSKEYPREYPKEYSKEYSKGYPKEYVKDCPKDYVKDYPKEYVKKEYVKGYSKEYAKDYPKEYVEKYPKKYPPKDYPTKDYRRRSPSPDRRRSHSREPQYRRSPSHDRHRSHSRDYGREDGSWGVDIRYKQGSTPEKHHRSSRWQPRS
ncbi:hypothetical protein PF005_g8466 [Phytophthora fragariae]|nr:hypothetical protein PF005_g8466 [Phytophthora fragariae]KAE9240499.1 hypothetical protein PF004_g7475 [Phytophthora fragariae]KAE9257607.1 hypothetical protein PF002_g863 [Phytophthora fragariae]KAE9351782.1 hypothetical protein PF008_g5775 [Phytophthora fragariae]